MKTHLIYPFYYDCNPERRKELETCFFNNMVSVYDFMTVVTEVKDEEYVKLLLDKNTYRVNNNFQILNKTVFNRLHVSQDRPAFQRYIEIANRYPEYITVICNTDIYIDPTNLNKIKELDWKQHPNLFLGLSRWDIYEKETLVHLDRGDSQDFFAWCGFCNVMNLNCPIGYAGVDNHILYKFHAAGYNVQNPSKDIQVVHVHQVLGNNYRKDGFGAVIAHMVCPEPYYFKKPHFVNEINN